MSRDPDIDNPDEDKTAPGEPTLDGRRISLADLQAQATQPLQKESPGSKKQGLKRFWAACNDFLAGMYTGESCAGTPHGERRRARQDTTESGKAEHNAKTGSPQKKDS